MDVAIALTPGAQVGYLSLVMVGVAPIVGFCLIRWVDAWGMVGNGPMAIDPDLPQHRSPELISPVTRTVQEAEARQMIEAKSYHRQRRGEPPLNIKAELGRALEVGDGPPSSQAKMRAELRDEVRQLVLARNERRMSRGQQPLDLEAEVERQLSDLIGSG